MEQFQDNGIVLAARPHGEGAAVVTLLTEKLGRHAGYVHGGMSSTRLRAQLQPGALLTVGWNARTEGQLGSYTVEDASGPNPATLDDAAALAALQSVCTTLERALPERESHPALFAGTLALLDMLGHDREIWGAALVFWELSLLRELGFGLDLSKCAVTGTTENLVYVSPKSGRAVSLEAAGPYKEKLLPLPAFLRGEGGVDAAEIVSGLKLSGYFLEHRLYAHTTHALPEPRQRLPEFFAE
ncbi:MAG: DNA repair protein RecO [Alphaproteobacteria bacterium]|nr:DNA repair protein RecO [Alphaproteobacteria bacterium]